MQTPPGDAAQLPAIDVVVPVFNESGFIAGKLADLLRLDYPRDRLTIWVVDGGSTDGTAEAVGESNARGAGLDVRLLHSGAIGKPAQLSAAFEMVSSAWVLVTDADARLQPSLLRDMIAAAHEDPAVALVGAHVRPGGAHHLDRMHWQAVNWLRTIEARAGCAGLVVGPAYLVRRELLDPFPAGTIMDDVHLCCRAALVGARIAIVQAEVVELRAPVSVTEFAGHKFRKVLGYIREVLHFLPLFGSMHGPARSAYIWRALLLFGIPIATLGAAALLAAFSPPQGLLVGAGLLACGLLLSSAAHAPIATIAAITSLPLAWSVLLTSALAVYPFVRQTPRYPKVTASAPEPS